MEEFYKWQQIAKEMVSSSENKDDENEIIDFSLATDRKTIEKYKFEAMRKEHWCEIVKIALEKYIKSEISEMISIINRRFCELEDKNKKYFTKSSNNKTATLATSDDLKERMLPSTVGCDFTSEDKKRNEEYLKTLEKIKSEDGKKTQVKNTNRKSSIKKGKK